MRLQEKAVLERLPAANKDIQAELEKDEESVLNGPKYPKFVKAVYFFQSVDRGTS